MPTKYVVNLGSLMSGLGKGVVTSSIGKILDFYNLTVLPVKFDGYLNYDCGTMNPYRHGEVFVLDDTSEVDMDFGIYERFLNKDLTGDSSITGGKLFQKIIEKERKGDFLGQDVQIIPHLTNEIMDRVEKLAEAKKPDVMIIEVGGTVGDIENSYFIEAMRQFSLKHDVVFLNLTYVPQINVVGEQKTKPAQIGFRMLLQAGIRPGLIICRSDTKLNEKTKEKLALFSNLSPERVVDDSDQYTLYNLPLHFINQGVDKVILKDLNFTNVKMNQKKYDAWKEKVDKIVNPKNKVSIAVIGKYIELKDSYASVKEALIHAGAETDTNIDIKWIESEDLDTDLSKLKGVQGVIVTGGFGKRGTEGMINSIKYARENKIPYLGLCLGMQMMVVEFARNVCGLKDANSTELEPETKNNVIYLLPSQRGVRQKGGTMRLGAQDCLVLEKDSNTFKLYGKKDVISERHRHRYEFNNKYMDTFKKNGLKIVGMTTDKALVEFVEWNDSFGVGTQAHPELKSRFEKPAPLFVGLVDAALKVK